MVTDATAPEISIYATFLQATGQHWTCKPVAISHTMGDQALQGSLNTRISREIFYSF